MSTVGGFEAYDDAIAALRLMALWKEDASAEDKAWVSWRIVFVDPAKAQSQGFGLLAMAAWELYGIDLSGEHQSECSSQRVIDWDGDSARIAASIRQAYGITWEQFARETSFRDACAMIGLLPRDTPMGTAIHYRVADPPKPNGHNAEQIEAFRKIKKHYEIPEEAQEKSLSAMAAFSARLRGGNG